MKNIILRTLVLFVLACTPLFLPIFRPLLPAYAAVSTAYEIFFLSPFLLFVLVAFLGLRLNQTRIFYSMILITMLFIILHNATHKALQPIDYSLFLQILLVLSVLNFFFLFAFDEGALFGWRSFLRAASIVATVLISYLIVHSSMTFLHLLFSGQWLVSFNGFHLPDFFWPVLIGTAIFFLMRQDKSIDTYKIALLLSLVTLVLVFNRNIGVLEYSVDLKMYNAVAFAVIGLISLYAVYKLYWQNVYIDELTAVPNRRAFNEQLKKLGRKYTIAMLDIDYFKKFNDTFGHTEGDNVLRFVAKHLQELSRSKVFRYGGEEFSIIFPGHQVKEVLWNLEHIRETLEAKEFFIRMSESKRSNRSEKDRGKTGLDGKKVKVTISIGVAQRTDKFKTVVDVIQAADMALYTAKKKGRNQCAVKHR
jgi:diguanylate cyclase (GGDEF)-like protein